MKSLAEERSRANAGQIMNLLLSPTRVSRMDHFLLLSYTYKGHA